MRVFSNSAMSVDGKLATVAHEHIQVGSAEDRRMMHVIRAQADAVVVGGQTFRNWPWPLVEDPARLHPDERRPPRDRPMINAVLTRRGVLSADAGRFPDPRVELHVFGGPELDGPAHAARFGARAHTLAEPGVGAVLDRLAEMGCKSVLVEGGGDLIFAVLRTGRLTDLFVTVAPKLIGGAAAPTVLDGPGLRADEIVDLRLTSLRRVDDELFLHYSVG